MTAPSGPSDHSEPPTATTATLKTKPRRSWLRIAWSWTRELLLLVVLFFFVSTVVGRLRAPDLEGEAPAFSLQTLSGETVTLSELRGKTVVLNFWALWCAPCRAEIPQLSSFARHHPEVVVLGIAIDGRVEELRAGKEKLEIGYPVLVGNADIARRYGASTIPTTVIIGPDGHVKSAHVGIITEPQLKFAVW